ncbi:Homeobox protein Hox-B1a [Liparis tanakae]|uniref:Homeobox protein Hox-B1a n=1 Tax=Liparis tanakae TaxID=230148 RepID=A0A4Z2EXT2_9TELE|nr:Homeobox protein Hox-B1a [Liparis tanakae]
MNSFVEYSIGNRPGTGASGYNPYHHHLHHHHPLEQHQGFPVASGPFHAGPTGSPAPVKGTRGDSGTYFMEEPVASSYYHQSSFPSSAPTGGPSYGALAGAYCGPQGALAGPQYPQQLGGGLDAAGYLGLQPGGGYGELPVCQDRERGDEEGHQAGQGQTFDWMKVKRNPPKTGMEEGVRSGSIEGLNPAT